MSTYHTYSATDVAYVLLSQAFKQGKRFTNLQVQKLVYVCHGLSLAHFDRPLIIEDVHAWKYGPVVPSLYFKFKHYGSDEIEDYEDRSIDDDSHEIVCQVIEMLGGFTGAQLIELTHRSGSPWYKVWTDDGIKVIPDALIRDHYLVIKKEGITTSL